MPRIEMRNIPIARCSRSEICGVRRLVLFSIAHKKSRSAMATWYLRLEFRIRFEKVSLDRPASEVVQASRELVGEIV